MQAGCAAGRNVDIEDSLEDIGFKSGVHGGELDSLINLRWDGAPYQFSLDSGQGSATLTAHDGRIKETLLLLLIEETPSTGTINGQILRL